MNAQLKISKYGLKFIISLLVILFNCYVLNAQTPVAVHGQLSISGNRLKDKNGNNYQLRGMSMFWSNWQGKFWNYETIKWLRDDWNCNIVRAAMGISPDDNSGYLGHPEVEKQKMITVIEAAIDLGIYVVVDWHSHHAENETAQAKAFFAEIAQKYGSYPNIIYETYNEPITDWATIKTYHTAVVAEIRKYDTKNVIILGTPFYSQEIDNATNSPLSGSNLSYALHYYAASHTFWNSVGTVSTKGYYVFVSEFGTCDASGAGAVDAGNSNTWWNTLDQYGVSWCNWAVSDVSEAAAIVKPGSSTTGGWNPTTDLTTSGILVRNKLRGYTKDAVPTNIAPYITSNPQTQSVPFQSSATFTVEAVGTGTFSYKWYFKGAQIANATTASYNIPSVTPSDTGSYYVVITNSVGSTTSKTARLDVRYRSTFYSTSQTIPGIIQFEDYDKGGQNIGYYDDSYGNSGGKYRQDDVDIEALQNTSGQYNIGFLDNNEWLSYSVNVGWDGSYTSDIYYSSANGGGTYTLYIDDVPVVSKAALASTGGWFTYGKASATYNLTQGEHILKFKVDLSGYNVDYIEFKSNTPPNTAPIITAQPKNTNANIGKTASLSVTATGAATLKYQWYFNNKIINGATATSYTVTAVAQADSGDYYVVITNSLGTKTSNTVTLNVLNTAAYQGIPSVIPGRVLCKNWDEGGQGSAFYDSTPTENLGVTNSGSGNSYRENAVDVEACSDGGSGFSIGYIVTGEWLEYSVNVKYTGSYEVGFRVATGSSSTTMALGLNIDGTALISSLAVPNIGSWTLWTTLTKTVNLTAGNHILRFKAISGDFNINYINFALLSATTSVSLNSGWNLFSLPIVPADTSVDKVFTGITNLEVKSQDQFYKAGQATYFNTLTKLTSGKGYLVYNGGAKTSITINGLPSTSSVNIASLNNGWNLVGNSGDIVKTNTTGSTVLSIKNFDGFYIPGNAQSTITTLQNGKAYFIKILK